MVISRQFVSNVSKAASGAVKHPLETVEFALGAAKHAVAKGTAVADLALAQLHSADWKARHAEAARAAKRAQADRDTADAAFATHGGSATSTTERAEPDDLDEESGADDGAAFNDLPTDERPAPEDIREMPMPDLEPPVPVVEEVLAEEADPEVGHATEPSAATRDEAHGEAPLQRAEEDEIAEEVAEAFPAGEVSVETPVGTTGADVAFNPDTAEADLQQPGTEPLLADDVAKATETEAETLSKASDTD